MTETQNQGQIVVSLESPCPYTTDLFSTLCDFQIIISVRLDFSNAVSWSLYAHVWLSVNTI